MQPASRLNALPMYPKVCRLRGLVYVSLIDIGLPPSAQLRVGCDLITLTYLIDEYTDHQPTDVVRETCAIIQDALLNPWKERPEHELLVGQLTKEYVSTPTCGEDAKSSLIATPDFGCVPLNARQRQDAGSSCARS